MQKPKYDKYKPLPKDLAMKPNHPNEWFSGYVLAKINYGTKGGQSYSQNVEVSISESPQEIYDRVSTKPLGIGKFRVTFASVHFCNVTVQVV